MIPHLPLARRKTPMLPKDRAALCDSVCSAACRVSPTPEVVICPFLPELLPLIPHQDILRPPGTHYV